MATTSMQQINKAGKMALVRELLITGISSQADIRRALAKSEIKISKATICRYVKQILEEWAAAVAPETRERWRGKELAKIDKMEQRLHTKCMAGDVKAIAVRLRLMQHRADLLGLTEPENLNIILTPTVIMQRMQAIQELCPVIPVVDALDGSEIKDVEYELITDADDS